VGGLVKGFHLVGSYLVHRERLQCYFLPEQKGWGDLIKLCHVGILRIYLRVEVDGYSFGGRFLYLV
jgi:hypothetical protein